MVAACNKRSSCFKQLRKKITTKLRLELDYGFMPIAQSLMPQFGAVEVEAEYSDQVVLVLEIELREVSAFTQTIINKSGAKAIVTPIDGQ
jgi:putative IMPACT (imprinted ancient) family translation regulator